VVAFEELAHDCFVLHKAKPTHYVHNQYITSATRKRAKEFQQLPHFEPHLN
jgi:hypothetical protein